MQTAFMPNVTIRNVPIDVHQALVDRAAQRGQSLQRYLVEVLREASVRASPSDWVRDLEARMAADPGWPVDLPNAGAILREERDARS